MTMYGLTCPRIIFCMTYIKPYGARYDHAKYLNMVMNGHIR